MPSLDKTAKAIRQNRRAPRPASARVATIRQYLEARLIDELHLAVSPALLGKGENLFVGLDLPVLGYEVAEHVAGEAAMHVVIGRRG